MKRSLLSLLCCPRCGGGLSLPEARETDERIETGLLACQACSRDYPVVRFVPRFVPAQNYTASFGIQWKQFRQTQLDSYSGVPVSRQRFFRQTGWSPAALEGKRILDVGCGAGRFAEIALSCGAEVIAVDYSEAVDACWLNLGHNHGLNVLQGDLYHLPFKPGSFDFLYCFGVLQHTPDVGAAFAALPPQLGIGGRLAVDIYPKLFANIFWPKYWLRAWTKRMPAKRLLGLVGQMVPLLLPLSRVVGRIPIAGRKLRYLIPVANYEGIYPLSESQLREWAVLDTFDMLAPAHDRPQSADTLRAWFERAGLREIQIFREGFLVGRAVK